jgi:hypothetical protein
MSPDLRSPGDTAEYASRARVLPCERSRRRRGVLRRVISGGWDGVVQLLTLDGSAEPRQLGLGWLHLRLEHEQWATSGALGRRLCDHLPASRAEGQSDRRWRCRREHPSPGVSAVKDGYSAIIAHGNENIKSGCLS